MSIYEIFGCSHQGCIREHNEDHILLGRFIKKQGKMSLKLASDDDFLLRFGLLLGVSDGIGGENAGEVASRMALSTLDRHFYAMEKQDLDQSVYSSLIQAGVQRANESILRVATANAEKSGMGCTLAGICLMSHSYLVFNAGDRRVCRFRDGYLKQLTEDETLAQMATKFPLGALPENAANASHTLTNSLGTLNCNLTITEGPALLNGDLLLICSDGLYDMVNIDQLEILLGEKNQSLENTGQALMDAALEAGGHDNISIILLRRIENEQGNEQLSTVISEEIPPGKLVTFADTPVSELNDQSTNIERTEKRQMENEREIGHE